MQTVDAGTSFEEFTAAKSYLASRKRPTPEIASIVEAQLTPPSTDIVSKDFKFYGGGSAIPTTTVDAHYPGTSAPRRLGIAVAGAAIPFAPGLQGAILAAHVAMVAARAISAYTEAESLLPISISTNWWKLKNSSLPGRVFNELMTNATSAERLSGARPQLSEKSVETFLLLWNIVGGFAREPVISISPGGCVMAEWYHDARNSLAVLANDGSDLHYSLFDGGAIIEGSTTRDNLAQFVAAMRARVQNPFTWSDA